MRAGVNCGQCRTTIQHYLGHKNLETTALYLGVSDSDKMRDKINEAFGD
jgi:hypothetical protein